MVPILSKLIVLGGGKGEQEVTPRGRFTELKGIAYGKGRVRRVRKRGDSRGWGERQSPSAESHISH